MIELLVVIAIIAILAAMLLPALLPSTVKLRHNNATNVSFIDGHTATYKISAIPTNRRFIFWLPYNGMNHNASSIQNNAFL